jgi:hypothetical protein
MASSMTNLMAKDPDWWDEACLIRDMLWEAGIYPPPPGGETPQGWCKGLFLETSGMARLAETMVERGMKPEQMGRALDIVANVLPAVYLGD